MDTEIKFKATFLTKAFWVLIIIGVIISIIIFLSLKTDLTYRYMLSMLIVFLGILVVFFVNRNEPEKIEIREGRIQISFFNKVFFKRKPLSYSKQELDIKYNNDDIIKLFKDDKLIVIIRKEAIKTDDWEKFKGYFFR